jgi:stage II sporulation protein P
MDKRKKINYKLKIKILFLLFIVIISFICTIKWLDKVNLKVDDLFLYTLLSNSSNIKGDGISSSIVNYVIDLDFFSPLDLLKNNYKGLTDKPNNVVNMDNPSRPNSDTELVLKEENKPIVYIFNTHQSEEYASNTIEYNIKPTVMTASFMLEERLKKLGIDSIVEENNITELLRINNWNYASSYRITKMLMTEAKEKNPSLLYFIDLHRDSVPRDKTTVEINGNTYAKVLFLLGMENPNHLESEKVISRMNDIIKEKYPGISKGIYKKGGSGVNGVYNQDFSSRCILIEVGGIDNTLEEVSNTIDAITYMIKTYIGEANG